MAGANFAPLVLQLGAPATTAANAVTGVDGGIDLAAAARVRIDKILGVTGPAIPPHRTNTIFVASNQPVLPGARSTLQGGQGDDWIVGGSGMDNILGRDGDDKLYGGTGNDMLNGGAGVDRLSGGDDDDVLQGGTQVDTLLGGDGIDTLQGEAGNDILRGGDDNDTLQGGDDDDTLDGGRGNDALDGGNDDDTYTFLAGIGSDHLIEGWGHDTVTETPAVGNHDVLDFSEVTVPVTHVLSGGELISGIGDPALLVDQDRLISNRTSDGVAQVKDALGFFAGQLVVKKNAATVAITSGSSIPLTSRGRVPFLPTDALRLAIDIGNGNGETVFEVTGAAIYAAAGLPANTASTTLANLATGIQAVLQATALGNIVTVTSSATTSKLTITITQAAAHNQSIRILPSGASFDTSGVADRTRDIFGFVAGQEQVNNANAIALTSSVPIAMNDQNEFPLLKSDVLRLAIDIGDGNGELVREVTGP
ncbi:MAG: hypothetical protein JJ992_04790 [Planctomycetes bacterium]|nr:hypothetical protein [Planctomycetota bacterium]